MEAMLNDAISTINGYFMGVISSSLSSSAQVSSLR